ncbi:MAG: DNRLRE domain-containing protein [Planctomycetes bacterium]|nr:DNRLRE domain-containing protein [Planctomycetota bacterium]
MPCSKDNTLFENPTGALSAGAGLGLYVGKTNQFSDQLRRAVLHFDVAAAVPAGALILDASLTVMVAQSSLTPPTSIRAHRLTQDWGEGTSAPAATSGGGGGANSTPTDATWVHTFFPGSQWNNVGGDFAATASFVIATPPTGSATSALSANLIADVQSFLDSPAQNFGWLLKTDEIVSGSAVRLDSRENLLGSPPVLQITYLTNGEAGAIGQGCLVGGQPFTHSWSAAPIGGTTLQLTMANGPANALAANLMSLTFSRTGVPIGPPCPMHLPFGGLVVTHSLVFLSATGSGAANIAIPPGFPGVMLTSQAAAIASNPAGFILSNGMVALLQ